jgi:hypothetical protein
MSFNSANFKRPFWVALSISLVGVLLASNIGWAVAYNLAKNETEAPAWLRSDGELIVWGSFWLAAVGAVGLVASLIWWLMGAIANGIRPPRAQRRF